MSFDPLGYYAELEYQYPLGETYPVVRIPVAGPEPFNTLVVVRGWLPGMAIDVSDGTMRRYRFGMRTSFRLIGFDPRVDPPFEHSTTAVLQMIQTDDDCSFCQAVDDVVGGTFDTDGYWVITADVASAWDGVLASANCYYSSWVLCYEPPPPEPSKHHGDPRFHRYVPGLATATVQPLPSGGAQPFGKRPRQRGSRRPRVTVSDIPLGAFTHGTLSRPRPAPPSEGD